MLILTCGPSGSGKTTIIKHMLNNPLFSVIPVDVVSADRVYECGLGRNQVTIEVFRQNEMDNVYTHVYQYNEQKYGINMTSLKNNHIYLLDYPGEYPECIELMEYDWVGILVLPPTKRELVKRLKKTNREDRISSAVKEYKECMDELRRGKYASWFVIINSNINITCKLVDEFVLNNLS
jgi:guanylate kinase